MEDKSFLLIIIVPGVLVFLALFNFIGNGEAFGLGPIANGCIGKTGIYDNIRKYFPVGEWEIKTPIHIKYFVPEPKKVTEKTKSFCLGQNMR